MSFGENLQTIRKRNHLSQEELAELPAADASFWFTYSVLQEKSPEVLEGISDWKRNPMATLPAWVTLISKKL